MNILIKPRKNRYIIYAIIIALFSTIGMQISLLHTNIGKVLEKIEYDSVWNHMMSVLRISITRKSDVLLFYQIAAAVIFIIFLMVFSYKFSVREVVSAGILSILFGFTMWFRAVFSHKESWNYFVRNSYVKVLNGWYILGYALLAFGIFLLVGKAVTGHCIKQESSKDPLRSRGKGKNYNTKTVFLICMAVLIVFWLPYYIVFWPGFQHTDLPTQMLQFFHIRTRFQGKVVTDGINIFYSNDHPFLQTMLVGWAIKLGFGVHNINFGYAVYSFIQMILFIVAFSSILATLYHFKVSVFILKISLCLYAIVPVFPLYALLIGGDSFFSVFYLFYMVGILWIFYTKGDILKNNKFIIAMIIEIILMSTSKNQGVYVAAAVFVLCLIYFKRYRIRISVCMLIPILLFQFVYCGSFFKIARVGTTGKQEALSVCFQQTARYIKYHGDEVTSQEKEAINKVLNYDVIGKRYDPNLSDPVKRTFKLEATGEDLKNYFVVWLQMGLKHPGEYIQSFIANTYGYYTISFGNHKGVYFKPEIMDFYIGKRDWVKKDKHIVELLRKIQVNIPEKRKIIREKGVQIIKVIQKIPIFNCFFNPGTLTWLMVMGFFVLWTKRKYNSMLAFLPVFLIFGVCLLSPKNNNLRYIYPLCCMIPAMLAAAFGEKNTDLMD